MWRSSAKSKRAKLCSILVLILLLCAPTSDITFVKAASTALLDFTFCYDQKDCSPSAWPALCKTGAVQSPINLEFSRATKPSKSVNLVLSREYGMRHRFFLENTGTTFKLYLNREKNSNCLIKGSGFLPNEPYFFYSLHFHWGAHENIGSEHSINGRSFPLELHMIHKRSSDQTKYAVLGILFQISENDNPALTPILENLYLVQEKTSDLQEVPSSSTINLSQLLPKKVKFFRYAGSLTTPPCSEGIIWTVFDDFQTISRSQLEEFRKVHNSHGRPITNNYRPTQKAFTSKRKRILYMKSVVPRVGRSRKGK